ncbi:hypothetical protein F0562_033268 [Nyssa sinensis]|uniref:Amine oxidase n=1 Tax=Nyssa sinensis TaxID=561372 RepID=A0A5J5ASB5_9ASTE|nr:hypothetical protein F0562_033268 [Nyssa sinensis]
MLCLEVWYFTALILVAGYLKNAEVSVDAFSICMNILCWAAMIAVGCNAAIRQVLLNHRSEHNVAGVAIGAGWQAFVACVNIACYYLFGVPVGLLMGFKLKMGVTDAVEYAECEAVVKDFPPFREAMKRRGIDDMDLVMVDPWSVDYYSEADGGPDRRLSKPLIFCKTESDCPMENGYARPVEGIYILVDIQNMVVVEFEDRKLVPLPLADPLRNYTHGETRGGVDRSDLKPLQVIQPEGPSFRVDGHFVQWQKDGKIEADVKLTGILSLGALQPGEVRKYGTTIAPGLYAPIHQHFFVSRMDMAVDYQKHKKSEPDRAGYKLVPGSNCLPSALAEAKFLRRATFLKYNLWVTSFSQDEMYPGGEFPDQNPRVGEGLATWVKQNRPLEETGIVLWYVFGVTHIPRLEDWPVMPVERIGFILMPHGFFNCSPAIDVPPSSSCHSDLKDNGGVIKPIDNHELLAKL